MPMTAMEGIVENGRIRLREDVSLPENTRVFVIIDGPVSPRAVHSPAVRSPRLARPEQAPDFRKVTVLGGLFQGGAGVLVVEYDDAHASAASGEECGK